ncbi:hypothetical protein FQA39_LY18388 [Lamprigera yunnana]|nr:hypothetical protein FQA39_LY18388 [Lamprigera yunnana]
MLGYAFQNVNIIAEMHFGFKSVFTCKCEMSEILNTFTTESETEKSGASESAVYGAIAIATGHSQLTELFAALNMHQMSCKTYVCAEKEVLESTQKLAENEMLRAGQEKRELYFRFTEISRLDALNLN